MHGKQLTPSPQEDTQQDIPIKRIYGGNDNIANTEENQNSRRSNATSDNPPQDSHESENPREFLPKDAPKGKTVQVTNPYTFPKPIIDVSAHERKPKRKSPSQHWQRTGARNTLSKKSLTIGNVTSIIPSALIHSQRNLNRNNEKDEHGSGQQGSSSTQVLPVDKPPRISLPQQIQTSIHQWTPRQALKSNKAWGSNFYKKQQGLLRIMQQMSEGYHILKMGSNFQQYSLKWITSLPTSRSW